jgi:chromosome segregation ATPase
MDRPAARQAVLQALGAENTRPDDVVQDAQSKDKALQEAEARVLALVQQRQDLRRGQRESLERQISRLQEACKALDSANQEDQQALRRWQAQKATYVKDMTWALGFLTDDPAGIRADPKKS